MTNIAIIEDEFFAADHLRDFVQSHGFKVHGVFHSGEQFLKKTDWKFDAAIVDIFLSGELTGLDVAKALGEHQKPFIFLTANQDTETLKQAARLSPQAYISKPFKDNDISAALEIINHQQAPKIPIRGSRGVEWLSTDEILYIKADGAYIELHTLQGMILQRKLLKDIVEQLPENFVRVHRSYLINKAYVQQQTSSILIIKEHKIPISQAYKTALEA